MTRQYGTQSVHTPQTEQALRLLERFSLAAQLTFDRLHARQSVGEAERAIPGETGDVWRQRLVEVGESLNLRVRSVNCSVQQAVDFLTQQIPMATCQTVETPGENQELCWFLLSEYRRGRVRWTDLSDPQRDEWISLRKLQRRLRLVSRKAATTWVLGQPALSCGLMRSISGLESGQKKPSLLGRLVRLMRLERRDLWIIVVFSLVVGVLALATPVAVEALVNTVAFGRFAQPVVVLSILLLTFLGFAAAMRALITWMVELLQRRFFVRVVEDLAYRLPRVSGTVSDKAYGPELVNRFFDVVTVQKSASSLLIDGLAILLNSLIGMAVLAFYHPFLLGFDIVLLFLVCFAVFVLGRGAFGSAVDESKKKYAVAAWLQELVRHPTAFKLHGGAEFAMQHSDELAVEYLDARRGHFRILMRQVVFALALQALAATVLLGLGGWLVIVGQLTLGQLVAAELIVTIIVGSFAKLGKHMETFYDLIASLDKLGKLFDLPIEPHDKWFHLRQSGPAEFAFRGVHYGYPLAKASLTNLDFAAAPGESLALLTAGGPEESIAIDLLCGLREPSEGYLELDGIDIRELRPDSLREHLGVARTAEVFAGSIVENVQLHRAHLDAQDVRDALELVGLLEDVLSLPDGLNTQLQTGGCPLSQGQIAQLMIARAIAGSPRLLVIDGTLDYLPDDIQMSLLERLLHAEVRSELGTEVGTLPWTLVIVTGRRAIAERCQQCIRLTKATAKQNKR